MSYQLPAPSGMGGVRTNVDERSKLDKADNSDTKVNPDNRYKVVEGLASRVVAARDAVGGRMKLVSAISNLPDNGFKPTGSAVWRAENNKVHPDEVDNWFTVLTRIESDIQAGKYADQAKGSKKDKADNEFKVRLQSVLDEVDKANRVIKEVKRFSKSKEITTRVDAAVKILSTVLDR